MNKVIVYPLVLHPSYSESVELDPTLMSMAVIVTGCRWSPPLAASSKGFPLVIEELQRDIRQVPKVFLLDLGEDSLDDGSPHRIALIEPRMALDQLGTSLHTQPALVKINITC
jgi:hypothetical protein